LEALAREADDALQEELEELLEETQAGNLGFWNEGLKQCLTFKNDGILKNRAETMP